MTKEEDNKENWAIVVLIATIFLFSITLAKILFFFFLGSLFLGIIWLIIKFKDEYSESYKWPLILLIIGLLDSLGTYWYGYIFERTEIGSLLVGTAESIINTDKTIKSAEDNATQIMVESLVNTSNDTLS